MHVLCVIKFYAHPVTVTQLNSHICTCSCRSIDDFSFQVANALYTNSTVMHTRSAFLYLFSKWVLSTLNSPVENPRISQRTQKKSLGCDTNEDDVPFEMLPLRGWMQLLLLACCWLLWYGNTTLATEYTTYTRHYYIIHLLLLLCRSLCHVYCQSDKWALIYWIETWISLKYNICVNNELVEWNECRKSA